MVFIINPTEYLSILDFYWCCFYSLIDKGTDWYLMQKKDKLVPSKLCINHLTLSAIGENNKTAQNAPATDQNPFEGYFQPKSINTINNPLKDRSSRWSINSILNLCSKPTTGQTRLGLLLKTACLNCPSFSAQSPMQVPCMQSVRSQLSCDHPTVNISRL